MMRALPIVLALVLVLVAAAGGRAEPVPELVGMANALRAGHGLPPLKRAPILEAVAEAHGRDMARRGYFAHRGADGSTPGQRARRAGYRFCVIAENIARGQRSPRAAMDSWAGSPGHRANMLDRRITEIGVIRAPGDTWVMVLGNPGRRC